MNEMLDRPADYRSESTAQRIRSAAEPVIRCLLFAGETRLTGPITGTSSFVEDFSGVGPCDQRGRTLREFDLTSRLFKYPCSYLIYSDAFDALPAPAQDYVYKRCWDILSGNDTSGDFTHLTAADREDILEILRDTKRGLPEYWN
jgi:hypothetical protein